ncbi:class I SAM-dependent methyltransferase [Streptacidiphilus melanogenes]|uniref:class I SAM-dependent methyltransferase n=1 Tax=Streptacidiphilus melanogenes TaxID=411235 RepID=UPI0006938059|nr:class I SAM-dependent methyltransferase [Streptacidiphilus melanogenes]
MASHRHHLAWQPAPSDAARGVFDRWAAFYDRSQLQDVLYRPAHAAVVRQARRVAPHARWVLDIGCGTGLLLRQIATVLPHAGLVGVDPSFSMAVWTREALPTPRGSAAPAFVAVSCAEQLPFHNGAFDLVLSTLSAHHWSDPARAATEIARVAAPGAVLLIAEARWQRRSADKDPLLGALGHCGLRVGSVEPLPAASLLADVELITATA